MALGQPAKTQISTLPIYDFELILTFLDLSSCFVYRQSFVTGG